MSFIDNFSKKAVLFNKEKYRIKMSPVNLTGNFILSKKKFKGVSRQLFMFVSIVNHLIT